MNGIDERVRDAQLDWALGEAAGGDAPPDLLATVRRKLAATPPAEPARRPGSVWFAAACLLLGLGVLAAVWCERHAGGDGAATHVPVQQPEALVQQPDATAWQQQEPQDPQVQGTQEPEPDWQVVSSREEIAKLPADTAAVRLFPRSADDVAALARLPQLAHLDLGLSAADTEQPLLDASMLQAAAKLTTLRTLRLDYRVEIATDWLQPLERLPLLDTLHLAFVRLDDAGAARLQRLPSLRRLYLPFDLALGDAGLHAIAGIPGLRELSVRGCTHLTSRGLAELGRAQQLQALDVGVHGRVVTWKHYSDNGLSSGHAARKAAASLERFAASGPRQSGFGVDDDVLRALRPLTGLRTLRLDHAGAFGAEGLAALQGLPLRELDLALEDRECAPLVAVLPPSLEVLNLRACRALTDADLQKLAERLPRLQRIDLADCTAIGDAGVQSLVENCPLRWVGLRGCTQVTRAVLPALLASPTLQHVDTTDLAWARADVARQLAGLGQRQPPPQEPAPAEQQPTPQEPAEQQLRKAMERRMAEAERRAVQLERKLAVEEQLARSTPPAADADGLQWTTVSDPAQLAALPARCTAVRMWPASVADIAALARLPKLQHLDLGLTFAEGPQPPLDAAMLQAVGKLTTLRELRLDYRREVDPTWLRPLEGLPLLATLRLKFVQVDGPAAQRFTRLPSLQRLDLSFDKALDEAAIDALAGLPGLRELSLRGSGGVTPQALARLAKATRLEALDLSCCTVGNQFPAINNPKSTEAALMRLHEAVAARRPEAGDAVTDEVLVALRPLANLRELRLRGCRSLTAAGLAALADLPLRALELGLASEPARIDALPRSLQSLVLEHVDDGSLGRLAERLPDLEQLDLSYCHDLTDAGLEALLRGSRLHSLRLRACSRLTRACLPALLAAESLRQLDLSLLQWTDDAVRQQLQGKPGLQLECQTLPAIQQQRK